MSKTHFHTSSSSTSSLIDHVLHPDILHWQLKKKIIKKILLCRHRPNLRPENLCGAVCQSSLEFIAVPASLSLPLYSLIPIPTHSLSYNSPCGSNSPLFSARSSPLLLTPLHITPPLFITVSCPLYFFFFSSVATYHQQLITSRLIFCPPPLIRFCSSQKRWRWNETETGVSLKMQMLFRGEEKRAVAVTGPFRWGRGELVEMLWK